MAKICIPKENIGEVKATLKKTGAVRLNEMTLEELSTEVFGKHLQPKEALFFANSFKKALISERQNALKSWFSKNLTDAEKKIMEEKSPEYMARANALKEDYKKLEAELDKKPVDIADIMARNAYSTDITEAEVEQVTKLTNELKELKKEDTDNLTGFSDNYYKKYNEIYEYIDKINPMSTLDKATKIWGRGALLSSASSAIFNSASNAVSGTFEAITRRAGAGKFYVKGSFKLTMDFVKEAHKIYVTSGIDVTRAMLMQDRAHEVLGEHFKQVDKTKFTEKPFSTFTYYMQQGVFKYAQGLPDIWASSLAFADSVALQASRVADAEGLSGEAHTKRTQELMKEIFNFKTLEKEQSKKETSLIIGIRQVSVNHAKKATGQDDRKIVQWLLGARNKMDEITPLNLGTLFNPFLKTPVNYVITSAFEYSPIGFVKGFIEMKNGDGKQAIVETLTRAGLGSIFMMILMAILDDDEYMNAYEMAGKDEKLSGNAYNSIIVGSYSISTDMLGFLQIPVTTSLSVGKAKQDEKISAVWDNVVSIARKIPVFDDIASVYETSPFKKKDDRIITENTSALLGQVYSRTVPNIVSQLASSYDGSDRQKDYNSILSDVQIKIPVWREKLPVKQDVLGKEREVNAITTLLFGARVKKVNETPETRELRDLMKRTSVATDISGIKEVEAVDSLLKKQVISKQEYDDFMYAVKQDFGNSIIEIINSDEYKELEDPEDKAKLLTENKKQIIQDRVEMQGMSTRVEDEMEKMKN